MTCNEPLYAIEINEATCKSSFTVILGEIQWNFIGRVTELFYFVKVSLSSYFEMHAIAYRSYLMNQFAIYYTHELPGGVETYAAVVDHFGVLQVNNYTSFHKSSL